MPSSKGLWACCGDNGGSGKGANCTRQTSDTFHLAAPQDLLSSKYFEVPATGFPFTTATQSSASATSLATIASASSTSSDRPSEGELGSSSLSIGAAAGVGIGAGLAVIGIAGLSTWYLKSKRRRALQGEPQAHQQFHPQTPVSRNGPQREGFVKPELTGQGLGEMPA
ncbi:hypothetical protein PG999_009157 [Apiospora kogelbergensis]|uniref:Uncharacterized protein n=1 Tax=Apiospora kogelbergensis TaxID=1337665 RepID=A0AAW0QKH7_9PEZI